MFDLVWRGDESIHKRNVIGEGFRLSVVIQQTRRSTRKRQDKAILSVTVRKTVFRLEGNLFPPAEIPTTRHHRLHTRNPVKE